MSILDEMVGRRWTWQGPLRIPCEDSPGGSYFELRVAELEDFYLAAETPEELERERIPALRGLLESYLLQGEPVPVRRAWVLRVLNVAGRGQNVAARTSKALTAPQRAAPDAADILQTS